MARLTEIHRQQSLYANFFEQSRGGGSPRTFFIDRSEKLQKLPGIEGRRYKRG
jgi:hypothetical protein